MKFQIYTNDKTTISERTPKVTLPSYQKSEAYNNPRNYVASEELKNAINVAIALGQPLLLTGEPGTGKTQLANNMAWQLEVGCHKFHTKSTSTAKDLFYRYDSLRHFHDAQVKAKTELNTKNYIEFQALGKSIAQSAQQRSVVLIDEIDKAPRDFPNDVLNEIDNMEFTIRETGQQYVVKNNNRPIVVITSNSEKNLPDAFLRRCVYFNIPFPNKATLIEIVNSRLPLSPAFQERMLDAAIDHFIQIRALGLRKKPATAELLSWIHILNGLDLNTAIPIDQQIKELKQTYSILAKSQDDFEKIHSLNKG